MNQTKILGPFALAMIAVVAIVDLRSLPMMASYGTQAVFLYSLVALLFFIPISLVSAELATNQSQQGGMYAWVRNAFGERVGFFSMWLEWLNNVIGFPASLSFIAVTLVRFINPQWVDHKLFICSLILLILWATTFFAALGIKASSRLNMVAALLGTIFPALLIIVLGFCWLMSGMHAHIDLSVESFIPSFANTNPGFFAAMILGYGGMQIVGFHSQNVKNPLQTFPRAIFISIGIIFTITVLTALAIALVIPHDKLNLVTGLIDSYNKFFNAFHASWATPILIGLIIFSLLATLNAWFIGPSRGLVVAAENGFFPKIFVKKNKRDMPINILLLQGLIGSLLSLLFLFMPDVNSGFWVLLNLSSQSALIVYILIFACGIRHRYLKGEPKLGFKIPGKNWGMWLIAGTGIFICCAALTLSFIPPQNVKTGSIESYEMILVIGNFIFLSIPFLINHFYSQNQSQQPVMVEIQKAEWLL